MSNPEAGAIVAFEGLVRNHNEGKPVDALEYEVYQSLAIKEGQKILEEAKLQFNITGIKATHREGLLQIGDAAVIVAASSKHRDAAFKACRYVIDEIKHRLPVWKKEHYVDGAAVWVDCKGCYHHAHVDFTEDEYYRRQTCLKTVGFDGQEKLRNSRVLVIGAGGLGVPALTYLVSSGCGTITVCDDDKIAVSNLHRQTLYAYEEVGQFKAVVAKQHLADRNPFVKLSAITTRIIPTNVTELVANHDIVLDCTDNLKTKFMLHDACHLEQKTLVQSSIYQQEGQLQVFSPDSKAGCLRCTWPTPPDDGCVGSCADVGVIGAVPGVFGAMQAMETIKVILGTESMEKTVIFDLMSFDVTKIARPKDSGCALCGTTPAIHGISDALYTPAKEEFEINASEIDISKFKLLDIREPQERNLDNPWEMELNSTPMSTFDLDSLAKDDEIVLVCAKGIRSKNMAKQMRTDGYQSVFSLVEGVSTLANL